MWSTQRVLIFVTVIGTLHASSVAEATAQTAVTHVTRAEAHRSAGRFEAALLAYSEALNANPGLADAHSGMGYVLAQLGSDHEAADAFRRAVDLDADSWRALAGLGNLALRGGRPLAAVGHFRTSIEIRPATAWVHVNLGDALRAIGALNEARAAYYKAHVIAPGTMQAGLGLAAIHLERAEFLDAARMYDVIIARFPEGAEARHNRGIARLGLAEHTGAIRDFQAVLARHPADTEARLQLGVAYQRAHQYEAAIKQYEPLLNEMPHDITLRYGLAACLARMGRVDEARLAHAVVKELRAVDEAITAAEIRLRNAPGDAPLHLALANLNLRLDRDVAALAHYAEAARLAPTTTTAYVGAATVHLRQGAEPAAIAVYTEAVRANPRYANGYLMLGLLHRRAGAVEKAAPLFAKARVFAEDALRSDGSPANYEQLASVHFSLGDGGRAEETLERGLREHPGDESLAERLTQVRTRREESP
jgi:protein O-GlcNAc transferase